MPKMSLLSNHIVTQLEGLIQETVAPALNEDIEFTSIEQAQQAIQFLKDELDRLSPEAFAWVDGYEDEYEDDD